MLVYQTRSNPTWMSFLLQEICLYYFEAQTKLDYFKIKGLIVIISSSNYRKRCHGN